MDRLRAARWIVVGVVLFVAALIVFVLGLNDSALVDSRQANQQMIINSYARSESID